jgi:two-component system chemotaxis sensor kinase CheA
MASQTKEEQGPDFDLSAYKALYLDQAQTHLAILRQSLAQLRSEPGDRAALREAYRAAHTLKGMSTTMRYQTLSARAYRLEELLYQSNETEQPLVPDQITVLLADCDEFGMDLERLAAE